VRRKISLLWDEELTEKNIEGEKIEKPRAGEPGKDRIIFVASKEKH